MIFIPCRGGISHAEDELITWEAAAQGAQVLFDAVVARANQM
jgi:N-carbamoyl-L-amino-acid hydrolase